MTGSHHILKAAASVGMLLLSINATRAGAEAPTKASTPPVVPSDPRYIPSATFVEPGDLARPLLSPSGKQLAFRERINKKFYIGIRPVDSSQIRRVGLPEKHSLNWYRWAGDDRLLISVTGITEIYGIEVPVSGLMSYQLSTGKTVQLKRGKSQGLEGDDVLYVDPDGKYVLMALSKSIFDSAGVYKVDIAGNEATEIVKAQPNISSWYADGKGIVRMGIGYSDRAMRIYYRRSNDEKFELISKIKRNADEDELNDRLLEVAHIVSGKDEGYVLSNKQTGRFALYKFNYLTREVGEKVLDHPENDITDYDLNDDGTEIESATLTDDRDRIVWFDQIHKKHQRSLDRALPGQEAWMISRSKDGARMVVFSTSPTDPGSFYIYEPAIGKLDRFGGVNDKIDPTQLAVTKYVHYTARDGLKIPAYLTLPRDRDPRGLPLIILPHGGPYGVRDTLDFNAETQFLANRGYAVLQPNFRGSDSYGEEYYKKGEGQIGRAMQDDLDDGMDWLVKDGTVDPQRVCIVGSSYGGYAALWGAIRNPERYRCAASFAGVTDFRAQIRYSGKSMSSRYARDWKMKVQGDSNFNLDTVSPAKMAAKLNRPVLITHGDEDSNVPFSQYKNMMAALAKAGKTVDSHVYTGEGHGFADPANEKDWLDRLEAFLGKHNPANKLPDAVAAARNQTSGS